MARCHSLPASCLAPLVLWGCASIPDDGRPTLDDGWLRFEANDLPLVAADESLWCTFHTLPRGGGIQDARPWTDSALLHADHILVRLAPDDIPYGDGESVPCSELDVWWSAGAPLYEPADRNKNGGLGLPPGIAFPVEEGTRFVIDSHFINPTEAEEIADVIVDLRIVAADEIVGAAGAWSLDVGADLSVPSGERYTRSFDCQWQDTVSLLSLGGHMHEEGAAYKLEWFPVEGGAVTLLDIPQWQQTYSDHPPESDYEAGSATVTRGDVFRTTCTWENGTGEDLGFPREMCTTIGVGYPLPGGAVCTDGIIERVDAHWNPLGDGVIQGFARVEEGLGGARTGTLFVVLRYAPLADDPAQTTVASVSVVDVDLTAPDAVVAFEVVGFPPRAAPYVITAVLAADGEMGLGGPDAGDLIASGPDGEALWVAVPDSTPVPLEIVLNEEVP